MKLEINSLYKEDYFSDRGNNSDDQRIRSYKDEYRKITKYIKKGNVLDVGCGMGEFLELFSENSWNRFGIEISEHAAKAAQEKSISMINFENTKFSFDLIVLRGVFQHLEYPIYYLDKLSEMLNKGGYIIFLATPNTGSLYYKLFGNLPMLDPKRNFVVPSDVMITNILKNMGFEVEEVFYPYLTSPYSKPIRDHLYFGLSLLGFRPKFPFWKNMMEIYAKK